MNVTGQSRTFSSLPPLVTSARGIYRYGAQINSHDLIKTLAILTMVVDNVGVSFMDDNLWMQVVGRMAAPLFFYLVGYSGSYRFKNQILSLGIALWLIQFLVSDNSNIWERIMPINILISFVLTKAILNRFDPVKMRTSSLIILLAILLLVSLPTCIIVEYGSLGLCIAIGARLVNKRHPFGKTWIIIATTAHFLLQTNFLVLGRPDVPMQIILLSILLLAAILSVTLLIFAKYELRVFTVNPVWLRNMTIFISRYSLQIYFFHLAAFTMIHSLI